MALNLARLFSYTRQLEQQIIDERDRHARELQDARDDRNEERDERRRLQDRVVQKFGVLPVFETPAAVGQSKSDKVAARQYSPREATVVAGKKRADVLFEQISKEAEEYKKQFEQNGHQAPQPSLEATD